MRPALTSWRKARQEIHQRRLAGAAHAHEGDDLAAAHLEYRCRAASARSAAVAERHALEGEGARVNDGSALRARAVGDGRRRVENLEHALDGAPSTAAPLFMIRESCRTGP